MGTDLVPFVDDEGVVHDTHTLQHLYDCMEQELENSLISPYGDSSGADEETCKRWEKMLGIIPDVEATLDDRIFAINLRLFQAAPYSINKIQHILDSLLGKKEISLVRNVDEKTLLVIVRLSSRFKVESVREMLDNMIPANMSLTMKIDYTTYEDMEKYTHDELSQYTHDEIVITEM